MSQQSRKINYTLITDTNAARIAFQNGELDSYAAASMDDYELFSNDPAYVVEQYTQSTVDVLAFNTTRGVLSNILIRQAISYAIDKEALSIAATGGMYPIAYSYFNTDTLGGTDAVPRYEYNPDKARELLAEAGYNGETIGLLYTSVGASSYLGHHDSGIFECCWDQCGYAGPRVRQCGCCGGQPGLRYGAV